MKNLLVLLSSALVASSLVLGGCAADGSESSDTEGESEGDTVATLAVETDSVTPSRLGAGRSGYIPRIKLADLKGAGARCSSTHCDYKGESWDCSGGEFCTNVSR